jgi:hypothetical protein
MWDVGLDTYDGVVTHFECIEIESAGMQHATSKASIIQQSRLVGRGNRGFIKLKMSHSYDGLRE